MTIVHDVDLADFALLVLGVNGNTSWSEPQDLSDVHRTSSYRHDPLANVENPVMEVYPIILVLHLSNLSFKRVNP